MTLKVINLFGGPGSGKSTTAAALFYHMKLRGMNVELVTEYAKNMVYENRPNVMTDQLYMLAKQNRKQHQLRDTVEWAITDSPLLLNSLYQIEDYYPSFDSLVLDVWNTYDNFSFLLDRKDLTYVQVGRVQNEAGAHEVDKKLLGMLGQFQIDYRTVESQTAVAEILNYMQMFWKKEVDYRC